MKKFFSRIIYDTDQHQTAAAVAISCCNNFCVNSGTTSGWPRHLRQNCRQGSFERNRPATIERQDSACMVSG